MPPREPISYEAFLGRVLRRYGVTEAEMEQRNVRIMPSESAPYGWKICGGWTKLLPADHRAIAPMPMTLPPDKIPTVEAMLEATVVGDRLVREVLREGETLTPCTCKRFWCRGWRVESAPTPTLWEHLLQES